MQKGKPTAPPPHTTHIHLMHASIPKRQEHWLHFIRLLIWKDASNRLDQASNDENEKFAFGDNCCLGEGFNQQAEEVGK